MDIVAGIIIGLIVLTLLIVLHEGGHFVMSRRSGVRVKEFGIGFPPRAIAWVRGRDHKWHRYPKKDWKTDSFKYAQTFPAPTAGSSPTTKTSSTATSSSTSPSSSSAPIKNSKVFSKPPLIEPGLVLSINWLPIGGFCSMDGESDADTRKGTFGASSFWSKTKILFGGVLMNWLTAFVILTILAFTGLPHYIDNQFYVASDISIEAHPVEISEVIADSPADKAGLLSGDLIHSAAFNGITTDITSSSDLTLFNNDHTSEVVTYIVTRKDEGRFEKIIQLNDKDSEYLLGITMHSTGQTLYRSTWSAPIVGAITTLQLTGETFRGFGSMIGNFFSGLARQLSPDSATREEGQAALKEAGDSVSGPVGILGTLFPAFVSAGPTNLAFLTAIISISLACMNVLPIPALDGGRWLLIAIFRLRKKKLTSETESRIVSRAFLVLLGLAVLITILDILRIIN